MATPEPTLDPTVPHVLLFGHRGAGKSALVGALLQAGETQREALRSEVVNSSVDVPRIRDAVYAGKKLDPHQTELASYTLRLRPWRGSAETEAAPITVVLDDCDGKAAEGLLTHLDPLSDRKPDTPVARAVIAADAIVLLVDAASTDEQLAEAFEEFDAFLTVVGRAKTDAREVGGFPVYLVLTQCDRLARPGDTVASWESRVQRRVDYAWKTFDAFLKDADPEDGIPSPFLPFGSIDLNVFAAAVRHPPIPGATAPNHHPYQVAELFRDCFAEAGAHRARVRASDRRLWWTARSALAAVVVLLASLATVAIFPPRTTSPELADRVRDYIAHEPMEAATRLSDGEIDRNKKTLARFTSDARYRDLEPDLRAFVDSRVKEIENYEAYRAKLASAPVPADARTLPDLVRVRESLRTELALPPQYGWGETAAARLRDKWLADCDAIEAAQKELVNLYREYDKDASSQLLRRSYDAAWRNELKEIEKRVGDAPRPLGNVIPGSTGINQTRGEAVTWSVPYDYDEVQRARRYLAQTHERLKRLYDLAEALGATTPARPNAPLVIPEPSDKDDSAKLAGERLAKLVSTHNEWEVRPEFADQLKRSFDAGVHHVQKLMNVPNPDTKESWKALAAKLGKPPYDDWGKLLHLLARLQKPSEPNPVAELSKFLADLDTKKFELNLYGFELSIPLDFTAGLDSVEVVGPLTVTVARGNDVKTATFKVGKSDLRTVRVNDKDVLVTVYPLTLEGNTMLAYIAGDDFRAELPVKTKTDAKTLALQWEVGASNTFRFDRLSREPRVTKKDGGTDPAPGVKLTLTGGTMPQLPVLMLPK